MRVLLLLSLLFSPLGFADHHSESKNDQIIFLLDLEVIEGKERQVDDLIDRLVENVEKTEPGTIAYEYFASTKDRIFLYEVYENHAAAEFHVDSFCRAI